MNSRLFGLVLVTLFLVGSSAMTAPPSIEKLPTDPKSAKIVLVAGSNYYKAGEHDYIAACAVLADLLQQTPGVTPVLALDWPKNPETFAGAKAIVLLFDGGDKHGLLKADRMAQIQKLAASGVGIVQLHQVADYPTDLGERARNLAGGAFEKGHSQRAHWVYAFENLPQHPITNGVKGFKIDDGWLYRLRFVEGMKGVTPLLRTPDPKAKKPQTADETIVAWAYERPTGGKSFTFTGAHLHASFEQEGYRRFLVNGILWAAGLEVPANGAKVALKADELSRYLTPAPAKK